MANPQKLLSPTKHPKGIIAIFRNFLKTTFGNLELLFCFLEPQGGLELQEAILKEGEKFPKRKEIAIFRNSLETTFGNSERRNLRTNPVRADPEIRKNKIIPK